MKNIDLPAVPVNPVPVTQGLRSSGVSGWFKAVRGETALELIKLSVAAFILLYVIAYRARWSNAFNQHGLKKGQAFLGDHKNYGLTERQYRTAKKHLEELKFATFNATSKGTIATLLDRTVFDVFGADIDEQTANQATDTRRAKDGCATTNLDRKESENGSNSPQVDSGEIELPSGFPRSEQAARCHAAFAGCPEEFAVSTWQRAVGRGGRDAKDVPIRSFRHHLAAAWAGERGRTAQGSSYQRCGNVRAKQALPQHLKRLLW